MIKYHQMDAKQQQRRFVPFLCDRNPSSLHPPPSSGATGSYGPVGTVLKIVSTLQLNQTHSNSASTNTSGDESRLISCFELLMLRKRFFFLGQQIWRLVPLSLSTALQSVSGSLQRKSLRKYCKFIPTLDKTHRTSREM